VNCRPPRTLLACGVRRRRPLVRSRRVWPHRCAGAFPQGVATPVREGGGGSAVGGSPTGWPAGGQRSERPGGPCSVPAGCGHFRRVWPLRCAGCGHSSRDSSRETKKRVWAEGPTERSKSAPETTERVWAEGPTERSKSAPETTKRVWAEGPTERSKSAPETTKRVWAEGPTERSNQLHDLELPRALRHVDADRFADARLHQGDSHRRTRGDFDVVGAEVVARLTNQSVEVFVSAFDVA